jgi:hypothetical protein
MVAIVLLAIFLKIIWKLKYNQITKGDISFHNLVQEFIFSLLVMLFFVHPTITSSISNIFGCVALGDKSYLKADMSILCEDATYLFWRDSSLAYVILYCFGAPLLLGGYMFHKKLSIVNSASGTYHLFRFLVDGYTKNCFYWEIVTMMQKLFVVVVSVIFSPSLQVYFGLWILISSIASTTYFKPFVSKVLKKYQIWSSSVLYFTLMTSLLFRYSEFNFTTEIALVIMVVVLNGNLAIVFMCKAGPAVIVPLFGEVVRLANPIFEAIISSAIILGMRKRIGRVGKSGASNPAKT